MKKVTTWFGLFILLSAFVLQAQAIQNPDKAKGKAQKLQKVQLDARPGAPEGFRKQFRHLKRKALKSQKKQALQQEVELTSTDPDQILSYLKKRSDVTRLREWPTLRLDYSQLIRGTNGLKDRHYIHYVQQVDGVDIVGAGLTLTLSVGAVPSIDTVSMQLYPDLKLDGKSSISAVDARGRLETRLGAQRLRPAGERVRWIQNRWRKVREFIVEGEGLRAVVDTDGQTFVWEDRLYASYNGTVDGRFVEFDPLSTGNNLTTGPLKNLKIADGFGATVFTLPDGQYFFSTPSANDVPVNLTGRWVDVNDQMGTDLTSAIIGGSPNPANIHFNPIGNTETMTAQVNAYVHTNRVYEWLAMNGVGPVGIQIPLPTNVNQNSTCNAFYDYASINFFRSGGGCPNTAYDTVIYHEYGHFVDDKIGGITDFGLSEGWGDVLATYISGQPLVGEGFFGTPGSYIRHAENNYVYNPYDEVHSVGQAWMGFAWDLRQGLIQKHGADFGKALAESLVIPVLWANSPNIPSAVREVALRDDNDGNLANGTLNSDVLYPAAVRHGVAGYLDSVPPSIAITGPAENATVSNVISITGTAGDNLGLSEVSLWVDGLYLGVAAGTTSWTFSWDTSMVANGPHTLTARVEDLSGNTAEVSRIVITSNAGSSAATYSLFWKVPVCLTPSQSCDSGSHLVGRGSITNGPELNPPSNRFGACPDGASGFFHQDESLDRIRLRNLADRNFQPGDTVEIKVDVWAFSGSDYLALYYMNNVNQTTFQPITTLTPPGAGFHTLTAYVTLNSSSPLQGIRGSFVYFNPPTPCNPSSTFDDYDDLFFAVGDSTPTPPVPQVDVALSLLRLSPVPVTTGQPFDIQFRVTNISSITVPSSFTVSASIFDNAAGDPVVVSPLGPGQSQDISITTQTYFSGPAIEVWARLDTNLFDPNSSNDVLFSSAPVIQSGPDLTVSTVTVIPGSVGMGSPFTVRATISNIGNAASTSNHVYVYYDGVYIPTSPLPIPALAAGATHQIEFQGYGQHYYGIHYGGLWIDIPQQYPDTNYSNNGNQFSYTVSLDTTPPSIPAGVVVTTRAITALGYRWNPSTDNVGVAGYRIDVSSFSNYSFLMPGYAGKDIGLSTQTVVTGLEAYKYYYFRVRAYDAALNVSSASVSIAGLTLNDTEPPSPPTGLYYSTLGAGALTLNWSPAVDNVGIRNYRLDVSTASNFSKNLYYYNNKDVGNVTSHLITGLTPQTTYYARLRAYDARNNVSTNSAVAMGITTPDTLPPSVPGQPLPTMIAFSSFTITWSSSTDNVTAYPSYRIDVSSYANFSPMLLYYNNRDTGTGRTLTLTGLNPGTTYYSRVRSYDAKGNTSGNSVTGSLTLKGDTQAPTIPAGLLAASLHYSSATVQWTASTDNAAVTYYRMDVSSMPAFEKYFSSYNNLNVGNVTTRLISGFLQGTTYYIRVRAVDAAGNTSASSVPLSIRTKLDGLPPSQPANLTVTAVHFSSAAVMWTVSTDNLGVTGYRMDVSTLPTFGSFFGGYNNYNVGNGTARLISGMLQGTTYYVRVRATDEAGNNSPSSLPVSLTTKRDLTPPTAPAGLQITARTQTGFSLAWNPSTDVGSGLSSYRLDVSLVPTFTTYVSGYSNRVVPISSSFSVTGLLSGTTYYARMRAVDQVGLYSTYSPIVSTRTLTTAFALAAPSLPAGDPEPDTTTTGIGSLPSSVINLGQVRAFPNPWRADQHSGVQMTFDGLLPGSDVKLFTLSGRWIKTLNASTGNSVQWDRTNDSGDFVASGIYLYLVQAPSGEKTRGKIAIIR